MVDIIKFEDQEDGGALITIDLTHDELVTFAKVGIVHALTLIAEDAIIKHGDTGDGDEDSSV